MSEERIEVLRMVADHVITVDDAERLLRALDHGDRKRAAPKRERRVGVVSGAFDGVGEAVGAIGEVVEATLAEAVHGVEVGLGLDDDDDDDEQGFSGPTSFELPPGSRLSIRQHGRGSHRAGCVLVLLPSDDGRCTVEAGEGADVRTRPGDRARIRWRRGELTVRVPPTVAGIDARLVGGELVAHGLGCAIDARTVGGRAEITGARAPFEVRTTGGDLLLGLAAGSSGASRATSMGGALTVELEDGALHGRIHATTTGGEVRVDPGLAEVRREGHRLHGTAVIELGDGEGEGIALSVKSVGGDVVVRGAQRRSA